MARGGLLRKVGNVGGKVFGGIGKAVAGGPAAIKEGLDRIPGRAGGLHEALAGKEAETKRFDLFTPEQQESLNAILGQAMEQYKGSDFDFGPIADRARTQFQEKTVPTLAERFTGLGGQRSSAFGQQMGQAGADLESQLAALESQFGLEQGKLLQSLMALGLTPQFENAYMPRQQGILEGGARGALSALPTLGLL